MIFPADESIPRLDEVSREIVAGLPPQLKDPFSLNITWTVAINKQLHDMGKKREFMVCCHGSRDQGEWLLDVVWMKADQHRIVLGVESEWGARAEVEDDFDKLISIKSPRKLLLFSTSTDRGEAEVIKRLESNMLAYPYHFEGEEYMAINVRQRAAVRYRFVVRGNGVLPSVHFDPIEDVAWPWSSRV
jgi:hypothetical protein